MNAKIDKNLIQFEIEIDSKDPSDYAVQAAPKAGEMRISSTGKSLFLANVNGLTGLCKHPITGNDLAITFRLEERMSKHDGRRQQAVMGRSE